MRKIPCCICKIDDDKYTMIELHNEKAIAALCDAHKTEDNFDRVQNKIPQHQLQNVLNQYMEDNISTNNTDLLKRIDDLESIIHNLKLELKSSVDNQETFIQETVEEIAPKPSEPRGKVNEYGELI